ncbi:unnamed protein product [Arabidopsis thaliana]|nr:homeobox protein [Arabidopsis thaliana]ANM67985.1 homeobox protein [Arabidopsis thaliana]OAO97045.1 hypothetical protein AXX17_AT4G28120 [Arabidopsis thaliana]CAD5328905.1 unnamed protein product [Arabidopsis thaliana]|eukprot:NP_001329773.1 homeobox protein [Arabidopsis thaliana]
MKAMKKLTFWSRKKRKRKQACPSQPHHCSCEYSSTAVAVLVEPTAPPLPYWFDETRSLCPPETSSFPWTTHHLPHQQEETIVEATPLLSQVSDLRIYQSYQQYMVPNPTSNVHFVEPATAKRSVGIFGCVIELSSSLVRCFIP